jgi:hypothetical protein
MVSFLLFIVVGLHKLKIINYHDLQDKLSNNINLLKVVDTVNGETNLLFMDLENVASANTNLVRTQNIENGKRVILDSYEAVEAVELGIVVKITDDKVYLMDLEDNVFCYDKLQTIDVNLYQIIRKNQIIGRSAVTTEGINYYDLYVTKNSEYINWYL